MSNEDIFVGEREAATLLRLSPGTLANWRWRGQGPPFAKIGGRVLYEREALIAWVRDRVETSTTEAA
jgi:hypothetical protein